MTKSLTRMLDLHISEYLLPNELVDSVASAVLLNPSTLSWAGRRELQSFRMVAFYARFMLPIQYVRAALWRVCACRARFFFLNEEIWKGLGSVDRNRIHSACVGYRRRTYRSRSCPTDAV